MNTNHSHFLVVGLALLLVVGAGGAAEPPAGLMLTLKAGGQETTMTRPGVNLHVPAGASVSPLLPAGRFEAVWTGQVNADLRGDFRFKAAVRGALKVEINGKIVLTGSGDGQGFVGPSEEIRLNKGGNPMRVTFQSPAAGDAWLRLLWSEQGFLWEPVDPFYLTRDNDTPSLVKAAAILRGRELFLNRRCVKCHTPAGAGVPELAMDAPAFAGIGSRRNAAWLAKWIADPRAERPDARMPRLLHGANVMAEAMDMAAYLATLKDAGNGLSGPSQEDGRELIDNLHCSGCHNLSGEDADAAKISLAHVNGKFPAGRLAEFLQQPTAHYRWRRMPDFKLSAEQALAIAGELRKEAKTEATALSAGDADNGRKLVVTTGCLNCHALPGATSELKAPSLAQLGQKAGGCVAGTDGGPDYGFSKEDAAALGAFLATDRASLTRHVPTEFAARQSRELNCRACHGALEGFPPYERLGGKLKPEYMAKLIAGKVPDKPRPWLQRVMPKFPTIAEDLAIGLAHSHGYPGTTPAEPPADPKLAEIGRKLVGVDGGFSCISCHGVGDLQPTQVFEAEGINLALPARRLQRDYYFRWVLNPLRIEPQTKMPVYFDDEGNSPLYDVLDGKALKQLEAFWDYMRAGDTIKPPELPGF